MRFSNKKNKKIAPREYYQVLGYKIDSYHCVRLNDYDHTLAGRLGEIWIKGEGLCSAVTHLNSETDIIRSFKIKDLARWILALEVPSNPHDQLKYANDLNSRGTLDVLQRLPRTKL